MTKSIKNSEVKKLTEQDLKKLFLSNQDKKNVINPSLKTKSLAGGTPLAYIDFILNPGSKINFSFEFNGTREMEIWVGNGNTVLFKKGNKTHGSAPESFTNNTPNNIAYRTVAIYKEVANGEHPWLLSPGLPKLISPNKYQVGYDDYYDGPYYNDAFLYVSF